MRTIEHAKVEFEILEKTVNGAIITPFKKEILALIKKFGNSGQSGGSAPYTSKAISQAVQSLCMHENICPITGHKSEWCNNIDDKIYQNKRLSSVFKDGKRGKPYYINAIVFRGQNGSCFTSSSVVVKKGETIGSSQFIKLPFNPKTFHIDVIETEWHKDTKTGKLRKKVGGGWWTSKIKDKKQLKEVFEYYTRKK